MLLKLGPLSNTHAHMQSIFCLKIHLLLFSQQHSGDDRLRKHVRAEFSLNALVPSVGCCQSIRTI